jgi:hypothetical protein
VAVAEAADATMIEMVVAAAEVEVVEEATVVEVWQQ